MHDRLHLGNDRRVRAPQLQCTGGGSDIGRVLIVAALHVDPAEVDDEGREQQQADQQDRREGKSESSVLVSRAIHGHGVGEACDAQVASISIRLSTVLVIVRPSRANPRKPVSWSRGFDVVTRIESPTCAPPSWVNWTDDVVAAVHPLARLGQQLARLDRWARRRRRLVVDDGDPGSFSRSVSDIELLIKGPTQLDDPEENDEERDRQERELDQRRAPVVRTSPHGKPPSGDPFDTKAPKLETRGFFCPKPRTCASCGRWWLAPPAGLEPATHGLGNRRSIP